MFAMLSITGVWVFALSKHKLLFDKVSSYVDISLHSLKLFRPKFSSLKELLEKAFFPQPEKKWKVSREGEQLAEVETERSWIFNVLHKYLHDCDIPKAEKQNMTLMEYFCF